MKKTIILGIIFILLVHLINALDLCDSPIEPSDVPCIVVTAWNYTPPCNSYTSNVYNSTPALLYSATLGSYGSTGKCNFTFNQSTRGSYTIADSAGAYGTIIVEGTKMEFFRLTVFSLIFSMGLVFIYFMHKYREENIGSSVAFGSIAAAWMVIIGSMIVFGFDVIITEVIILFNVNYYITIICYAMAFYAIAHSTSLYRSTKEKPGEYEAN